MRIQVHPIATLLCVCVAALSADIARAQAPRLEHVRTIGCATCDGPAAFASIAALEIDGGHVIVLDTREPFVRVFDGSGALVRASGRQGKGPGEFAGPAFMGVRKEGLQVVDLRTRRVTVVDAKGEEVSSMPFRGFPIVFSRAIGQDHGWAMTTDFRSPTLTIERLSDASARPDSVRVLGEDFPQKEDGAPSLFVALAARADGGFAMGDGSAQYRIGIYDATGRRTSEIRRDIERLKRTPAEMAYENARRARVAERARAMRNIEAQRSGGGPGTIPPVPELKAHFLANALAWDAKGRLWVRTERASGKNTIFDVFAGDGSFLGEVRVGERVDDYVIRGTTLAGVITDDDEVQYVALYTVTG
jgi:6-bladed beta-propeller